MELRELTRHLKPLKESKFSDFEVLQAMIKADIDPEEIASVTQLRGDGNEGIIRVAVRTRNAAEKLDDLIRKKRLCIGQVALAEVNEGGRFVKVILENVPLYLSDSDVGTDFVCFGRLIK